MNNDLIFCLYRRKETVFTIEEVAQLFPKVSFESLRDRLYYFTKIGKLKHLHRGIYAKNDYFSLELANKLYRPSYISLETVLEKEGVVFQHYETIFAIAYLTKAAKVDGFSIQYRRLKAQILTNIKGIEQKDGYFIASRERAFLDAIFVYKNYHFDNLSSIDWDKVDSFKEIYKSKVLEKRVREYYQLYKEDNVKH